MMHALRLNDVTITYKDFNERRNAAPITAVREVSLDLLKRGTLGIAGESGSGKSTLAMSILRLLPANAQMTGTIHIGDSEIGSLTWGEIRAVRWSEVAIVFQGAMHSLNPVQKVGKQIAEAILLHQNKGKNKKPAKDQIDELFSQVDLEHRLQESYPHELSGGQKQRVMIAMALACDPEIIIADEPTTALDVIVQAKILELLKQLVIQRGLSLLMISHDLGVLAKSCDQIAVMYEGRVVEQGESATILNSPSHPHTRALVDAVPVIGDQRSRLNPMSRKMDRNGERKDSSLSSHEAGSQMLAARNLTVDFNTRAGRVAAVSSVSISCRKGEVSVLVGQSGSGKTTLVRTLLGLQEPTGGEVEYQGKLLEKSRRALKQYHASVQFILQDPMAALNPKHTVYESVAEGIRIQGLPGDEKARVYEALKAAELSPPEQFYLKLPKELSGGQRQRVVIAGALALQPEFIIADEPVASLDASVRGEILALFLRLREEFNLGFLVITHDFGVAWNIADRVLVMREGRILEEGDAETVLLNPTNTYTKELLAAIPQARSSER